MIVARAMPLLGIALRTFAGKHGSEGIVIRLPATQALHKLCLMTNAALQAAAQDENDKARDL
jgi:hypothetical protein